MARTVVIAPDSFKGSLGAADAACALAEGWRGARPDDVVLLRPMADGGEGTLDAFHAAVPGARRIPVTVSPPTGDGDRVRTSWLLLPPTPDAPNGTGVVELASTAGIELLGDRLDPWRASTRGFGEAIAAALGRGVSRLVLAIGSSASTDGGAGLLTALGARFTDASARPIPPGAAGLRTVAAADLTLLAPPPPGGVVVLTDVTNPLLGPAGAAAVFGPQKGATPEDVPVLDALLARFAALIDIDPASPGAGAAGGAGFGLLAWGARLVPGAFAVAEQVGLDDVIARADLVITGEGSFDGQSASGKAPSHVAALAASVGVPAALVAGRIAVDAERAGFAASVCLSELAGTPAAALAEPARWLRAAGAALATSR